MKDFTLYMLYYYCMITVLKVFNRKYRSELSTMMSKFDTIYFCLWAILDKINIYLPWLSWTTPWNCCCFSVGDTFLLSAAEMFLELNRKSDTERAENGVSISFRYWVKYNSSGCYNIKLSFKRHNIIMYMIDRIRIGKI